MKNPTLEVEAPLGPLSKGHVSENSSSGKALRRILCALPLSALNPSFTLYLAHRGFSPVEIFFLLSVGSVLGLTFFRLLPFGARGWNMPRRRVLVALLLGTFGYTLYYFISVTLLSKAPKEGIPLVVMVMYTW